MYVCHSFTEETDQSSRDLIHWYTDSLDDIGEMKGYTRDILLGLMGFWSVRSWNDVGTFGFQLHNKASSVRGQKAPRIISLHAVKKANLPSSHDPEDDSMEKSRKASKKKKKQKRVSTEPPFWRNDTDAVVVHYLPGREEHLPRSLQFTIRGNPLPLRRHRTSRGFMYNPSAKAQECFRDLVHQMLLEATTNSTAVNSTEMAPFFGNNTSISLVARFSLRRPNHHFVASQRGRPLKASAPGSLSRTRTDVDNLAKFVLDSLNGLLYEDDAQVVNLCVSKALDNDHECVGSTVVQVVAVNSTDELASFVDRSFQVDSP